MLYACHVLCTFYRIIWLKNDVELNCDVNSVQCNNAGVPISVSLGSYTNDGFYQCMVRNLYGQTMSDVMHAQYSLLDGGDASNQTLSLPVNAPFSLPCHSPRAIASEVTRTWYTITSSGDLNPQTIATELQTSPSLQMHSITG